MFYEKLAEAKRKKKKRSKVPERVLIGASAGAGGLLGYELKRGMNISKNISAFGEAINDAAKRGGGALNYKAIPKDKGTIPYALGGTLVAGYGAKKLFDRYNQRKQRKD